MYSSLEKIKLLAFIVCHKQRGRSSSIHKSERKYLLATKIGISTNTYSKYLQSCLRLGYATKHSNGTIVFQKLSTTMQSLFEFKTSKKWHSFINVRFFKGESKLKFKELYEKIQFAISDLNFSQQKYFNNLLTEVGGMLKNSITSDIKVLKRAKKITKAKDYTELLNICDNHHYEVRTGKTHLSQIIGCSESTANNRLRKWHNTKFLRAIVSSYVKMEVNDQSFEAIKSLAKGSGVIVGARGFKVVFGSILSPIPTQ